MKIFQTVFLFFLIVPFVEIYLLLTIGGIIGALPTIGLVVFTAVLGAGLLRQQGFETWRRFQNALAQGQVPAYEMIEGPILLVGGALLLTPGFFTDALGFACLIPQLRRKFAAYVIENYLLQQSGVHNTRKSSDRDALEGEYRKED
ncbi:MAG: FxsA family protein [Gammaproteobacteria bacterium]